MFTSVGGKQPPSSRGAEQHIRFRWWRCERNIDISFHHNLADGKASKQPDESSANWMEQFHWSQQAPGVCSCITFLSESHRPLLVSSASWATSWWYPISMARYRQRSMPSASATSHVWNVTWEVRHAFISSLAVVQLLNSSKTVISELILDLGTNDACECNATKWRMKPSWGHSCH